MLRVVQHLVGEPGLDHLAMPHDEDATRQQPRDRDIVGDEHHRDAEPPHQ